jgi:Arm DNA-binding domain
MKIKTHINVHKAPPGRHNAGPGLYLIVSPDSQSRRWAFRFTKPSTHRVTEIGLGSAAVLSLADAREMAHGHRREVAHGRDPIEQKRDRRRAQITFAEVASAYVAVKRPGWRSESHWDTMRRLLQTYSSSLATKSIRTAMTADECVRVLLRGSPGEFGNRLLRLPFILWKRCPLTNDLPAGFALLFPYVRHGTLLEVNCSGSA